MHADKQEYNFNSTIWLYVFRYICNERDIRNIARVNTLFREIVTSPKFLHSRLIPEWLFLQYHIFDDLRSVLGGYDVEKTLPVIFDLASSEACKIMKYTNDMIAWISRLKPGQEKKYQCYHVYMIKKIKEFCLNNKCSVTLTTFSYTRPKVVYIQAKHHSNCCRDCDIQTFYETSREPAKGLVIKKF